MRKPFQAGYVSGASTMIRRRVIEQIGYLDERMFIMSMLIIVSASGMPVGKFSISQIHGDSFQSSGRLT